MNKTLKNIGFLIIILLLISIFFKISHKNDFNLENKILNNQNIELIKKNDSLILINKRIDKEIDSLNLKIENDQKELFKAETKIEKLKIRRNETFNNIINLSADSIAIQFSDFIKRHK